MSERYTKLFALPENMYAEGAPVVVSAGNLLKDNQTGKVLAQLKIKNISPKAIKAASVLIHALDTTGKAHDGDVEQEYLDLSVKQGEEFGQKVAITLPNASTRGFSIEVKRAAFTDNSTWEATGKAWEPLPVGESLSHWLSDAELVNQYRLQFGGKCEVAPTEHKDLWLCACGTWNQGENCYRCGKKKAALLTLDLDALKAEKDVRLAKEKAEREAKEAEERAKAEAKKAAAAAAAKKTKKILAIVIPALVLCLAAVLLATQVIIPNGNYNKAKALLDAGQYDEAIEAFETLDGYKDSAEQISAAKDAKAEAERQVREAQIEAENAAAYEKAEKLLNSGDYDSAITAFQALGNYRDSEQRTQEAKETKTEAIYQAASAMEEQGKLYEAATTFYQVKDYMDSWDRCFALWGEITIRETISSDRIHSVGLRNDGTVLAAGNNDSGQCNVYSWRNVVAISAGGYHTVALKADGSVMATGGEITTGPIKNSYGQCDISSWSDIVAISAGGYHTVGLKADGSVIAAGDNNEGQCNISEWSNIIAIDAVGDRTIGLRADGTVITTGSSYYDCGEVSNWRSISAISAGDYNTAGLQKNGTIIIIGNNQAGECDIYGWKDIVALSLGRFHTVGLKSDGTVVAEGMNVNGECDVTEWRNVVAISAGVSQTLGLRADGTVVAIGQNNSGQCNVSGWTGIKIPDK